jgi:hypothetical protein
MKFYNIHVLPWYILFWIKLMQGFQRSISDLFFCRNQPNLHIFCNNGKNQRHSITRWMNIVSHYPSIFLLSGVSILSYGSVPYFIYWFQVLILYGSSISGFCSTCSWILMYLHKTEDVFKNIKKVKQLQTQYVYLTINRRATPCSYMWKM